MNSNKRLCGDLFAYSFPLMKILVRSLSVAILLACPAVVMTSTPAHSQSAAVASNDGLSARFAGGRIYFESNPAYFNFTVSVSGPDGYFGQVFSERRAPSFRLSDHGSVEDGLYRFEITAATQELNRQASREPAGYNGRDSRNTQARVGVSFAGSFRVENGQVRVYDAEQET